MIEYRLSDGLCLLRLNAPPLNALSFELLEALRAALRRANEDPGAEAIVLLGTADHFSAGADLHLLRNASSAEDASRTSRIFQEAFQELEDSAKPVVAALAGRVLGGALELALACHVRICASGSTFAMPEVNLGINPGAGGTQRLPRLVGVETALRMLLSGEALHTGEALGLRLIDGICMGLQEIETLKRCARKALQKRGPEPRRTSRLTDQLRDAAANEAAFAAAECALAKVRPELLAPRKILEAVRTGLEQSVAAGMRAEQEAFAACSQTLATRNKMYLFFASRQAAKPPDRAQSAPTPIRRAAVVGMGTMGAGIVQALVTAGVPVTVIDQQPSAITRGMERIRSSLQKRAEQGRLHYDRVAEILRLISPATQWSELAAADLVIEAVYEDAATKQAVIGCCEAACTAHAILASNTSTFSLEVLAQPMRYPERLVGMHFFHPAQRMPLLEIVHSAATSGRVIATALQLAKRMGKTPVLVASRAGFLVNRIFIPYLKEAFWLLEEGAPAETIDAAMTAFGFAMGPLALIDMAGLDVLVATDQVMTSAFPRHGLLSQVAARLVRRGHLGQKTAAGVYKYQPGEYTPQWHAATAQIVAEVQRENGRAARQIGNEEITERLVQRIVGEAFYVVAEGVAARASDVDVALVLGTGFPDIRGGPWKYAHDLGLGNVLAGLERLAATFGQRFSPCPLLREMTHQP